MKIIIFILLSAQWCFAAQKDLKFRKGLVHLGGQVLDVEMAETPKQLQHGLMYRTEMPDGKGMLFIFRGEHTRSFWMKNTFVDLSIGFFDKNKKLVDIQQMDKVNSEMVLSPPRYKSRVPATYALEVQKGWFKRNKIKLGSKFRLLKPKQ